jgi:carbamate kinase
MLIVVAVGGNALLRRGEALTAKNQLANIKVAATALAQLARQHQLVVTHGSGPQVGLLALQSAAYSQVEPYPIDVLDAESEGMIGYLLEQEIANQLPQGRTVATLLTRIEVDADDPAFQRPSKPIGPFYSRAEAERLAAAQGWQVAPEEGSGVALGEKVYRRVIASPEPRRILGLQAIEWLLAHSAIVIAAGGGGIPVARTAEGHKCVGVEAVIDKDASASLLARDLRADHLLIATDVNAVYFDWGLPNQRALRRIAPSELRKHTFAAGSMGPKVSAACKFAEAVGAPATIGALGELDGMLRGTSGTRIDTRCEQAEWA